MQFELGTYIANRMNKKSSRGHMMHLGLSPRSVQDLEHALCHHLLISGPFPIVTAVQEYISGLQQL